MSEIQERAGFSQYVVQAMSPPGQKLRFSDALVASAHSRDGDQVFQAIVITDTRGRDQCGDEHGLSAFQNVIVPEFLFDRSNAVFP
jgi:hypothetical protein